MTDDSAIINQKQQTRNVKTEKKSLRRCKTARQAMRKNDTHFRSVSSLVCTLIGSLDQNSRQGRFIAMDNNFPKRLNGYFDSIGSWPGDETPENYVSFSISQSNMSTDNIYTNQQVVKMTGTSAVQRETIGLRTFSFSFFDQLSFFFFFFFFAIFSCSLSIHPFYVSMFWLACLSTFSHTTDFSFYLIYQLSAHTSIIFFRDSNRWHGKTWRWGHDRHWQSIGAIWLRHPPKSRCRGGIFRASISLTPVSQFCSYCGEAGLGTYLFNSCRNFASNCAVPDHSMLTERNN